MVEKKPNEEIGVEGEDYVVITRHTNLMTKVLYISDAEEKRAKSEEVKETSSWKEKIRNKIGKEI
jgi:hypothetical protein